MPAFLTPWFVLCFRFCLPRFSGFSGFDRESRGFARDHYWSRQHDLCFPRPGHRATSHQRLATTTTASTPGTGRCFPCFCSYCSCSTQFNSADGTAWEIWWICWSLQRLHLPVWEFFHTPTYTVMIPPNAHSCFLFSREEYWTGRQWCGTRISGLFCGTNLQSLRISSRGEGNLCSVNGTMPGHWQRSRLCY